MYIAILDEYRIKNFKPKGHNPILIRIFNPNNEIEKHNDIDYYKDVLELYLKDITKKDNINLEQGLKQLNEFILKNDFDEMVIHCNLGISRSPAIMICIAKILNNHRLIEELTKRYKLYNQYIVKQFNKIKYIPKYITDKEFIFEEINNPPKRKLKTKDNCIIIN